MSGIDTQRFFLVVFISVFTLLSFIRIYFHIVTGHSRNGILAEREGRLAVAVRYVFGIPLFAAVLLYIRFPELVPWSYITLPLYLRVTGILLGVASLYGIYRVHLELGRNFSSTLVIRKNHRLVRSGPYRLVRHPMYTSFLTLFLAAFFISENWVIGISGMVIIATLMTVRIGKEEALLLEHFGKEYEQYRLTTGMFLPLTHKLTFKKESKEESVYP